MTLHELITQLCNIRDEHGGDLPIMLFDIDQVDEYELDEDDIKVIDESKRYPQRVRIA